MAYHSSRPSSKRKPGDLWEPVHDAKLRELQATGMPFSQQTREMHVAFPDKNWSRNAIVGRAHRLGLKALNIPGGHYRKGTGSGRKPKSPRRRLVIIKPPRAVPTKALAPVVFKQTSETLLRDEGDRGITRNYRYARKLSAADPVVTERKKGQLPSIIEEHPLTSVPVTYCERESCMWPTSEDITCMEVCGAPVKVGSYCERHANVAYRVLPTKRRQNTRHKDDREYAKRMDGAQHREALDPDGAWLTRMIIDEVETAPADEPPLMVEHKS